MEGKNLQMKADIDKHGRVLIPAAFRHALNFHSGDTLVMRIINGELHVVSIEKLIKSTRDLIAANRQGSDSVVDALIRQRRQEESEENAKWEL